MIRTAESMLALIGAAASSAAVRWSAAWAAAVEAELRLQARDIRREIPEWPGGES